MRQNVSRTHDGVDGLSEEHDGDHEDSDDDQDHLDHPLTGVHVRLVALADGVQLRIRFHVLKIQINQMTIFSLFKILLSNHS